MLQGNLAGKGRERLLKGSHVHSSGEPPAGIQEGRQSYLPCPQPDLSLPPAEGPSFASWTDFCSTL